MPSSWLEDNSSSMSSWYGGKRRLPIVPVDNDMNQNQIYPDYLESHLTAKRRCVIMTESSATLPQDPCSDNGQSLNQDPLASQYGSNCLSLNNNVNPNLVISAQMMQCENYDITASENIYHLPNSSANCQVPCGQFIDDITTDLHDSAAMEIENVSPETNIPQVQTTSSSPVASQCVAYSRCYCKIAMADMTCSRAYYVSDYY